MTSTQHSLYNLTHWKRTLLTSALIETRGNRERTARLLGVSVRTVRNWMRAFRLIKRFPSTCKVHESTKCGLCPFDMGKA